MFELANICNFTPEEYREYEKSKKMNYDYYNTLDYGYNEGHKEGHKEGRAEGREERNLEIARNMLKNNIPVEVVANCTGLSKEEVLALSGNAQ